MRVRLLHSTISIVWSPSLSILTSTCLTLASLVTERTLRHNLPSADSFCFSKQAREKVTVSVSLLYLGSLCLGHGIRWNSWGTE